MKQICIDIDSDKDYLENIDIDKDLLEKKSISISILIRTLLVKNQISADFRLFHVFLMNYQY